MHVSLPRRYYRVGRSMRFLLWICFGLLAVVPWQAIRGQEQAEKPVVDQSADEKNWASNDDQAEQPAIDRPLDEKPKPIQSAAPKRGSSAPTTSLIFRGQDAPLQMTPLPISPEMQGPEVEDPGFLASDQVTGRSGQALGSLFRIGGFTGPAIGRKNALFPVEYMPYSLVDNNLIFGDFRGFKSSTDTWGANIGGGVRHYFPKIDRILGVNAFFDYDNTSGSTFRQVGFGAEWLGSMYDLRGNAYFPTGQSAVQTSLVNVDGTQQFVGHLLTVNRLHTFSNALHGFDGEIGVPIPGPVPERHDVRVFGGGYWYESDLIQSFGGWKTRIQANVIPSVSLQLEVTHDQQFKTNVVFGGSWSYGGFRQSPGTPKSQYDRMTTPVIRNYNIIVGTAYQTDIGNVVDDPTTGKPYFFEFVDSNSKAPIVNGVVGNGTYENPFQVFTNAQAAMLKDTPAPSGSDLRGIIFVKGGSVFDSKVDPVDNGPVQLQENVRVLGGSASVEHLVNTNALNSNSTLGYGLLLPQGTGAKPEFDNTPVNPVTNASITLANYSEFSGFNVNQPVGIGLYGSGITGSTQYSTVRQTNVTGAGLNSVVLDNTAGRILFQGDAITSSGLTDASTFLVSNTQANSQVYFTRDPLTSAANPTPGTITNNVTGANLISTTLEVTKTQANSLVDFTNSTVSDKGGNGVQIHDNNGNVNLGNATLSNDVGTALGIINDNGIFSSNGTVTITNSASDSIVIQNLGLNGAALFPGAGNPFDVNILDRSTGRGIYLYDNLGPVTFTTGVNIQSPGNVPFAAIDYQHNGMLGTVNGVPNQKIGGNASFNNIQINGGGRGILIGPLDPANPPNYGIFTVSGTTSITGTNDVAIEIVNDSSTVQFGTGTVGGGTTITNPLNIGIEVLSNNGTVNFGGTTTINQPAFSAVGSPILPAINIQGNTNLLSSVSFNFADIIGGNVPGASLPVNAPQYGVNIGDPANTALFNPASVNFSRLDILNLQNGTGLRVYNEGVAPIPATQAGASGTPGYGLYIGSGHILTTGGPAVDIEDSTISVTLNSVSDSISFFANQAPQYGIDLVNDNSIVTTNLPQLNQYMFTLGGLPPAAQNSAGLITGATIAGININQTNPNLVQTGAVEINSVTLQSNQLGLSANNLLQLSVNNSAFDFNLGQGVGNVGGKVAGQTGAAIDALNTPRVDIETSTFNQNGSFNGITNSLAGFVDHAIYLHATTPLVQPGISGVPLSNNGTATGGKYIWSINNNTSLNSNFIGGFTGAFGAGDVVLIAGPPTAPLTYLAPGTATSPINQLPVPLVFQFDNNQITVPNNNIGLLANNFINNIAAVDVRWTGQIDLTSAVANVTSSMNYNNVNLGGNDVGFLVQNASTQYATNFVISNNTLLANNGGNTGIFISDSNQTNLSIDNNNFNFLTAVVNLVTNEDYGMRISVNNAPTNYSTMDISYNTITMTQGPLDQGIVFPTIFAPASITFNGNDINITGAQPIVGQGIQFQIVNGAPVVLHGNVNNIISVNGNGAGIRPINWFSPIPSTVTQGQFIINGAFGP